MNVYVNGEKKAGNYEHQHGSNSFSGEDWGRGGIYLGVLLMVYTFIYMLAV